MAIVFYRMLKTTNWDLPASTMDCGLTLSKVDIYSQGVIMRATCLYPRNWVYLHLEILIFPHGPHPMFY